MDFELLKPGFAREDDVRQFFGSVGSGNQKDTQVMLGTFEACSRLLSLQRDSTMWLNLDENPSRSLLFMHFLRVCTGCQWLLHAF